MRKLTVRQYEDLFGWGYVHYDEESYSPGFLDYLNDLTLLRDRSNDPEPVPIMPGVVEYTPVSIPLGEKTAYIRKTIFRPFPDELRYIGIKTDD